MALTSYSDLKSTVAAYLARNDLTAQIPSFISLAETRMSRDLRIRQMLERVTATMTPSDATVGLPSNFLEIRDLFIRSNPVRSPDYMAPASFSRDARVNDIGLPSFYTVLGEELRFGPAPDAAYTLEMLYFARPQALSDSNPSNAFLANAPDALLYASLMEAEPYLMNDGRVTVWAGLYQRAIDALTASDQRSQSAGVPISMRTTTVTP